MLTLARSPLGAPGVFALPRAQRPALRPERMDVCAFVGVAPRGPARAPVAEPGAPLTWRAVLDGWPLQRSVPVRVHSFDEYVAHFGAFEGPGLLPHAVASYFEQGGHVAWVVRVVHARVAPLGDRCARGALAGAFTRAQALAFMARSEGSWGNCLQVALSFTTTVLGFELAPGLQVMVAPRSAVVPGATLRLTDAGGHALLARCEGLARVPDATRARERLALQLDVVLVQPPVRVELVELQLDVDDGAGRRERHERLALVADHPRSLASVLCRESRLLWPHPDWARETLVPAHAEVERIVARSDGFAGGDDAWGALSTDDFFDPSWSPAEEMPGGGITALAGLGQVTQLVVPDLYQPAQWAGEQWLAPSTEGSAGAEFAECAGTVDVPAAAGLAPSALLGLILDPRTVAGLDRIVELQQRVLAFCEGTQDLIALLDVPPGLSQARIEAWRARFDSAWVAAYHPWLVPARRNGGMPDPARVQAHRLPPSAVAAGIVARRELERGIQVGPANEVARQVVHVAEQLSEARIDALQPLGVNCFVREPRGIALVAARTLSRAAEWNQLSVRRVMLMLRRVLALQMQWTVFEPNGPQLWRDLVRAIESLLRQLFRAGVFAGGTEAESFFVRLQDDRLRRDRGELVVEVGVAPARPLEFILVRLRRDGDGTLVLEE